MRRGEGGGGGGGGGGRGGGGVVVGTGALSQEQIVKS